VHVKEVVDGKTLESYWRLVDGWDELEKLPCESGLDSI
jgi:hypothetical protein